jgi:hypothetical protein
MQAGPGLSDEASNANQPKGQVPGGAGGDLAAGISGSICINHLWPVVAGGGVMTKDEAPVQEPDLIARLKHPEQHYEFTNPKKANAVLMSLCQEAADALAAQPAVPDAMTSADIQEHIEYVAGWNECRQAMMEMMK